MNIRTTTQNVYPYQIESSWSRSEKAIARRVFDAALKRELQEVMREAKQMAVSRDRRNSYLRSMSNAFFSHDEYIDFFANQSGLGLLEDIRKEFGTVEHPPKEV